MGWLSRFTWIFTGGSYPSEKLEWVMTLFGWQVEIRRWSWQLCSLSAWFRWSCDIDPLLRVEDLVKVMSGPSGMSMICTIWHILFPNSFGYRVLTNIGSGAVPGRLPNHGFREGSWAGSGVPGRFRCRFSRRFGAGQGFGAGSGQGSNKVPGQVPIREGAVFRDVPGRWFRVGSQQV